MHDAPPAPDDDARRGMPDAASRPDPGAAADGASVTRVLRESGLDGLDGRVLLCHALQWPRSYLVTRADECLDRTQPEGLQRFLALAARRRDGEPVAQLVGAREFYGRDFQVTRDVLIPRPDTEWLVELALGAIDRLRRSRHARGGVFAPVRVLDLGTGSGAIAVTLAAERPGIDVVATDRSPAALDVARANASALLDARALAAIRFVQGDWFEALRTAGISLASFDLIVSNPPYIHRDDAHLSQGDLRFEPRGALTDEADGLGPLRILTTQAVHWLRPGREIASMSGSPDATPKTDIDTPALLVEHGYDQGEAVRALFHAAGWCDIQTTQDLGGQDRVTGGRMPG